MSVFKAKSYVEYVEHCLKRGEDRIPRGVVKETAEALHCHSTFISQVLHGKADFSHDQAVLFSQFQKMNEEESEFFIDLLNRDRASNPKTRQLFQRIISRKLSQRMSLQKRANIPSAIGEAQEPLYLNSWLPSAVHAALHIVQLSTPEAIAGHLKVEAEKIVEVLQGLRVLGLAKFSNKKWSATRKTLHIGRENLLSSTYHAMWRMKVASDLLSQRRTLNKIHYSSVFAITPDVAMEIRERLVDELEIVRNMMTECDSHELHLLNIDFCELHQG